MHYSVPRLEPFSHSMYVIFGLNYHKSPFNHDHHRQGSSFASWELAQAISSWAVLHSALYPFHIFFTRWVQWPEEIKWCQGLDLTRISMEKRFANWAGMLDMISKKVYDLWRKRAYSLIIHSHTEDALMSLVFNGDCNTKSCWNFVQSIGWVPSFDIILLSNSRTEAPVITRTSSAEKLLPALCNDLLTSRCKKIQRSVYWTN